MYFLKVLFSGKFSWFYLFNSSYCRYIEVFFFFFLRLLSSPEKSPLISSLSIETKLLTFYAQTSGWQSTDPYNHPVFSPKPKYHPLLYWEFENPKFFWDSSEQICFFLSLCPSVCSERGCFFCSAKCAKSVFQKCEKTLFFIDSIHSFCPHGCIAFTCLYYDSDGI